MPQLKHATRQRFVFLQIKAQSEYNFSVKLTLVFLESCAFIVYLLKFFKLLKLYELLVQKDTQNHQLII